MTIISPGFCIFLPQYHQRADQSEDQQGNRQEHQAGHQLIFILEEYRGFTQQIAKRGQDEHPQQAAHPVEKLKTGVIKAGKPGDGGQQRAYEGDKAADQQRGEPMLMKQVMRTLVIVRRQV